MSDESIGADKRQQDFDDLQREVTGQDVGRIKRFLSEGDPRSPDAKRKKAEQEQTRHRLAMLLQEPVYRARYDKVWDALTRAEAASEQALDQLADQIAVAQSALEQMEEDAARLPDGTLVFRDAAGVVRRADGSVVDDTLAATILWNGNEPRYEDYLAARDRLVSLEADRREVERYQTDILGDARGRTTDEANPPSLDDLNVILDDIEDQMPEAVREHMPQSHPEADPAPVSAALIPDLGRSN